MRTPIALLSGLLMTVLLASFVAQEASAGQSNVFVPRKPRRTLEQKLPPTISVAGEFSGVISGEIVIDGLPYPLSSDVTIYEVGKGPVPTGTSFLGRRINAFGYASGSTVMINNIIVRPARNPALMGVDPATFVRVHEAPAEAR